MPLRSIRLAAAAVLLAVVFSPAASAFGPGALFPKHVVSVIGRTPSQHYTGEVWSAGKWLPVYAFETESKPSLTPEASSTAERAGATTATNGYFKQLENWTASWVSSQIDTGTAEPRCSTSLATAVLPVQWAAPRS